MKLSDFCEIQLSPHFFTSSIYQRDIKVAQRLVTSIMQSLLLVLALSVLRTTARPISQATDYRFTDPSSEVALDFTTSDSNVPPYIQTSYSNVSPTVENSNYDIAGMNTPPTAADDQGDRRGTWHKEMPGGRFIWPDGKFRGSAPPDGVVTRNSDGSMTVRNGARTRIIQPGPVLPPLSPKDQEQESVTAPSGGGENNNNNNNMQKATEAGTVLIDGLINGGRGAANLYCAVNGGCR